MCVCVRLCLCVCVYKCVCVHVCIFFITFILTSRVQNQINNICKLSL